MAAGSHSIVLSAITVFALAIIPVKIAASIVGAGRQTIPWCIASVIAATLASIILYKVCGGGFIGIILALFGMLQAYKIMLQTSFSGAVVLSVLAFFIQLGTLQLLGNF